MGGMFSERKLISRGDISVHLYGDTAWVEFPWRFEATTRKDNSHIVTEGIETQIYHRFPNRGWALMRVQYTGAAAPAEKPSN